MRSSKAASVHNAIERSMNWGNSLILEGFFPLPLRARYVATIRKPEKLIIRDIIGENYRAYSHPHKSAELNAQPLRSIKSIWLDCFISISVSPPRPVPISNGNSHVRVCVLLIFSLVHWSNLYEERAYIEHAFRPRRVGISQFERFHYLPLFSLSIFFCF